MICGDSFAPHPSTPPQVLGTSIHPIPRISPSSQSRLHWLSYFCSAVGDGCFPRHRVSRNGCSPASVLPPALESRGCDTAAKQQVVLPGLGREGSEFYILVIESNWTPFYPLPGIIPYVVGVGSRPPA